MPEFRQRANINGFVLAGGRSRRMGRDKALLDWHGKPLLSHMIQLLSTICDPIRVIGREEFPDRSPGEGPLGGIATAIRLAETPRVIVVGVDLPLLTVDFLEQFRDHVDRAAHRVIACRIGSRFPLCLGISVGVLPDLLARLTAGDRSIHGWIENSDAEILTNVREEIFQNINTQADYTRALQQ